MILFLNDKKYINSITMNIPKSIIDMYKVHLHLYLDFMEKSDIVRGLPNEDQIVYHGWKMITEIMSIMYVLNKNNGDTNRALQESYVLYLEYLEQIYSKQIMTMPSPAIFATKIVVGHLALNDVSDGEKNKEKDVRPLLFDRITKWTDIISIWDYYDFTTDDRQILNAAFLTSYLENLTKEKFFFYKIIENIQEIWKTQDSYNVFHVVLLDKFYKCVLKQNKKMDEKAINAMCLEKFVCEKDYAHQLIKNIQYNKDVDTLLHWIFN